MQESPEGVLRFTVLRNKNAVLRDGDKLLNMAGESAYVAQGVGYIFNPNLVRARV
jgi:hypothetical protein